MNANVVDGGRERKGVNRATNEAKAKGRVNMNKKARLDRVVFFSGP